MEKKAILNILDYYKQKAFSYLGLIQTNQNPNTAAEDLMYVNNINQIQQQKLREYDTWYEGDSDKLLNLYTSNMLYEYQTEPLYDRNKRSYFWAVSATEDDVKRTHSGVPRMIIDTMVNIVGVPDIEAADAEDNKKLQKILKDNDFVTLFQQEQMPRTLVQGWGAYKIDYDEALRSTPIILYYRADEVDFIYRSNQLLAIIYKNYYTDEKGVNYILFETRRQERKKSPVDKKWHSNLIIEKELFRLNQDNSLVKEELKNLKQLTDVEPSLIINDYEGFLGGPFIFFQPDDGTVYGRSVYAGKIDLFDDLDQDLSQSANTVRRSTTHVYINNNYLERDSKTGMPIMPTAYDCKYVMLSGALGADGGSTGGNEPVMTVQPKVDFSQYSNHAISILLQIVAGFMSVASLGIDIAKKDNAEAQREKEKVTIFTRNTIVKKATEQWKQVSTEALCAQELMDTGAISKHGYDISVVFDEFADDSFEAKSETLLMLYNAGVMTPEMFVKALYSGKSKKSMQEVLDYIKAEKAMENPVASGMVPGAGAPLNPADMGVFGALGADNAFNEQAEKPDASDMEAKMNVPEMVGTAENMRK